VILLEQRHIPKIETFKKWSYIYAFLCNMFQSFVEPNPPPYNINEMIHEDFFLFENTIRFHWKQFFKNS